MSNAWKNVEIKESGARRYIKLESGENKIRLLSDPITGYIGWIEEDGKRKPVRSKDKPEGDNLAIFEEGVKPFIATVAWDYRDNQLKVFETDKATIIKGIKSLAEDEDYGDPQGYDLKIKKEGEDKMTRYTVLAAPCKPISKEIKEAFESTTVNLNALYDGGDPFAVEEFIDSKPKKKRPF